MLSMYSEQPSYILKSQQKENISNAGLNSYSNVPFMSAQYRTVNSSILNPEIDGRRFSESQK